MMLSLLARYFSVHDYTVDLVDVARIERARRLHIDAVIGVVFDDRIRALKQTPELPIVTVNKPMPEDGFHAVWFDHEQEAHQATAYLLARGHRRIGFLEVLGKNWGATERQRGYCAALAQVGVEVDPRLMRFTRGTPLLEQLGGLVRLGCTALVNFSEDAILEVPYQLRVGLGLRIPQDISLVSLETNPVLKYLTPALTVVHQPLHELARTIVETTFSLIRTPPEDGTPLGVRLESFLVEGASVATRSA
jgi:DNA-binding LacI/PurR family transcriptional regulator